MAVEMAIFALGWRGRQGRINRLEGGVLLAMFVGYTAWMVSLVVRAGVS
jgi:cation:H+ antiporter